jgi:hypothetical protein
MDYSSEACRTEFTRGQFDRMYYVWSVYRMGPETCATGYSLFEFEILTDDYPWENHWSLISMDGEFQWDTLQENSGINRDYPASSTSVQELCLDETKNYKFTIYDNYKDGINNPGYYVVRYNGIQLKRNSYFTDEEVTWFSGKQAPIPAPSPVTICFSSKSLVNVQKKGWLNISQIKIGDKVLVHGGTYSQIYSFGHRNTRESADFLQIHSQGTQHPIEISSDHLILLGGEHWVPAADLRVGDMLTKGDGSSTAISRIEHVTRKGVFAPFTVSGSIVVNDVVASNYVTFQRSEYLRIGNLETPLTFHWLGHVFESVHRLACRVVACEEETYTDSGISRWVSLPRDAGEILLIQHPMVTVVILMPFVVAFWILSLVERWTLVWTIAIFSFLLCSRSPHARGGTSKR